MAHFLEEEIIHNNRENRLQLISQPRSLMPIKRETGGAAAGEEELLTVPNH